MNQPIATNENNNEELLQIFIKGNVKNGDIVRAKKEGKRLIIEAKKRKPPPYRVYTNAEFNAFFITDVLPKFLMRKIQKKFPSL